MVSNAHNFYTLPTRRRGRPFVKKNSFDFGTPELRAKRAKNTVSHAHHTRTALCDKLYDKGIMDTDDLKYLTCLYKIRRCHLELFSDSVEGRSMFKHGLQARQKNCAVFIQKENRPLEVLWREMCEYLDHNIKVPTNMCVWSMLDQLFHTYDYDYIDGAYYRHKTQFSQGRMRILIDIIKKLYLVFERDIHNLLYQKTTLAQQI